MRKFYTSKILLLCIVCSISLFSKAQNNTKDSLSMSAKIDTIYNLQKKMYQETKNQPLTGKKFGIELNLFRILLIDKAITLSGTFSIFNVNKQVEIAFPVYYDKPEDKYDLRTFTIDCHYRYFLRNTLNGFYLSGFVRYAYLDGYEGNNNLNLFGSENPIGNKINESKLGIGFGLGVRIFSYKGLYWGASMSFGRYFIGENNRFYGHFLSLDDDEKYIFDIECLKFGWAF
jgi:hypothetical protein